MFGRINCESIKDTDKQYQLKKMKRYRSAFTTGQINYLEKQYKKCPYIGNASRKEVANVLNISERAIKIWFQNRRMKEKKEVIRNEEEYNLDSRNLINTVEFTNDSLNNVHSSQSTNDMHYTLQSNVSKNKGNINFTYHVEKKYENKSYPNIMKVEKSKQEPMNYLKPNFINNNKQVMTKTKTSKVQNLSKNNYMEKNNKKEAIISKGTSKTTTQNVVHPTIPGYQDLPEDLSAHKKSDMIVHQHFPESLSYNTGYIPLCNTQNYFTPCVSPGNVLWKPINLTAIPNSLQATSPQNQQTTIHNMQTQKINCTCDCHLKTSMNFNEGMKISQVPYVIAIPYHN